MKLSRKSRKKTVMAIVALAKEPLTEQGATDLTAFIDFCSKEIKKLKSIRVVDYEKDELVEYMQDLKKVSLFVLAEQTKNFIQALESNSLYF